MWPTTWNHWFTRWLGPWGGVGRQAGRRRRPGRRRALRPCLEALEDRTVPSNTVYWTGKSNPFTPNWSNAANWSGGVPQDGDTVIFTKGKSGIGWTSTVDAGSAASSVTLVVDNTTFGVLNLAHSLTLTGDSELAEEPGNHTTLNVGGNTLTNAGALTVDAPGAGDVIGVKSDGLGGAIVNQGTIVQQGAGQLQLTASVPIHNQAGATYDLASDGSITEGGSVSVLTNAGTMAKTGGTGTSVIYVAFSNLGGTLAADSGILQLHTADTLGASTGGTFNAAKGAVLDLTGGGNALSTNVFSGNYTGSGQGTVLIGGGAFIVGAGGVTFDFPPGLLQWGTGPNLPNHISEINLQGNTLTNTGSLTLSNPAGDSDELDGLGGASGTILGGTLINRGMIVQQGDGDLGLADGVQMENQAGATYDFVSDGGIFESGGGGVLSNAGTLEKTGGTDTSSVAVTFTNTGVVQVQSGTLRLLGGLPLNGAAALTGTAAAMLSVQGDVLGNTTNAALFDPLETVLLFGPGASSPQLLEVMSQDKGDVASGFVNNFAYGGTLKVAAGNEVPNEVRLVDKSRNSPGTAPEALYVNTLVVPAKATLDLNGFHVYVRSEQILGTVTGGSINVLPPPVLTAAGQDISATAGQPFSGMVATVTDTFGGVTAGSLQATITWGDGQKTAGTVSANGDGTFSVSGTHTYAQPGSYGLSVAVLDTANTKSSTAQGTATVQALVTLPPPPPPPLPPAPLFIILKRVRSGARVRLVAEVSFGGLLPPLDMPVPYQAPGYRGIAAALTDTDGDGIFGAVLFTASKGKRHVSQVVPL